MGGRLARRGTCDVSGSQAAIAWSICFSVTKLSPIWKSTCGTRASSGFWATKSVQAARASAIAAAADVIGGDQELRVEDRPLGVGTLGTVGEPGEIALPGGDRLGELLLPLKDLADLERGRHGKLGPVAPGLVGLDLEAFLLEERGISVECLGALAAGAIRVARSRRPLARPVDGPGTPPGIAAGPRRPGSGWRRRADWGCRRSRRSRKAHRPGWPRGLSSARLAFKRSMSRARSVQVIRAGKS